MILEHEFRGNDDFCTYKHHLTPCGKPKSEHVQNNRVHLWASVTLRVHNVPTQVQACTRRMCFVKWWPSRNEPTGDCKGL